MKFVFQEVILATYKATTSYNNQSHIDFFFEFQVLLGFEFDDKGITIIKLAINLYSMNFHHGLSR